MVHIDGTAAPDLDAHGRPMLDRLAHPGQRIAASRLAPSAAAVRPPATAAARWQRPWASCTAARGRGARGSSAVRWPSSPGSMRSGFIASSPIRPLLSLWLGDYSGKTSSHPWDGQIPCANTGTSRPWVGPSTEAVPSPMVVNWMVSVWPMAHVMQRNLDSIQVRMSQPTSDLCWDERVSVAPRSVETRCESLCHA